MQNTNAREKPVEQNHETEIVLGCSPILTAKGSRGSSSCLVRPTCTPEDGLLADTYVYEIKRRRVNNNLNWT
jgi:hypothetical protein